MSERTRVGRPAGCRDPDPKWLVALVHDAQLSSGTRYRDLARGLRAAIASGEVPVGARLPPQRELARILSVGRTTVVAAYNLLRAESLLVVRQGAGTWVVRRPVPGSRPASPVPVEIGSVLSPMPPPKAAKSMQSSKRRPGR
jgi:DNA-binding transcriptional MocR family regulator